MSKGISRRTVLKGLGVTMALPWLESMGALVNTAARAATPTAAAAATTGAPNRMIFMYVPNGKVMDKWIPQGVGKDYQLSPIMEPLTPYKNDFNVITGLAADKARANGDGGGDHARAMAAYLTGAQPFKTDGSTSSCPADRRTAARDRY